MSRFHSYISSASKIIESYDGSKPLQYHLKTFFSAEKKYGSRDRKTIATLCYTFFRLGLAFKDVSPEEKMLAGLFLSENKSNDILSSLRPEWNEQAALAVTDKLTLLKLTPAAIFPLQGEVSSSIDAAMFAASFLQQPKLYLRIRPGRTKQVIDKLTQAIIPFEKIDDHCLELANKTSLDAILKINKDAVIQDRNSQQVLNFIENDTGRFKNGERITAWDCCAASGGKSILLYDILRGKLQLTVSDIRENILLNLEKRLQQAGININNKFIADLSVRSGLSSGDRFSVILCDAPCTGSGTWGRTPEQLYFFKKDSISVYAERQKKIVSHSIPHLKAGGLFFYITCSVFKKENEEIVEFIKQKFQLPLLHKEYLKGYELQADSMFVAVFAGN